MRLPIRLVSRLAVAFAALSCGALACTSTTAPAADVCAEAKNRIASCGTSLPLLTDGPCSGGTRIVARCVVDHARDCDELATLFGRIDECVADVLDGGDPLLPPATDLPVPAHDAGADSSLDGAANATDAAPVPADGSSSSDAATALDSATETRP